MFIVFGGLVDRLGHALILKRRVWLSVAGSLLVVLTPAKHGFATDTFMMAGLGALGQIHRDLVGPCLAVRCGHPVDAAVGLAECVRCGAEEALQSRAVLAASPATHTTAALTVWPHAATPLPGLPGVGNPGGGQSPVATKAIRRRGRDAGGMA